MISYADAQVGVIRDVARYFALDDWQGCSNFDGLTFDLIQHVKLESDASSSTANWN